MINAHGILTLSFLLNIQEVIMQLKGIFQIIDWKESIEKSFDEGGKLTTAIVCQDYSGDIIGKSEIKFQMNYEPNGNATFIGFEFLVGNIAGKPCKLTIKHDGKFEEGSAKSQFVILNSSTHEELVGLKGYFKSAEGGQANFVIGS
jgi:hypothetical protein